MQTCEGISRLCAVVALLAIAPSCGERRAASGYWELEREREELAQHLKLSEYQLDRKTHQQSVELARLKQELARLDLRERELIRERSSLDAEIDRLHVQVEQNARAVTQQLRARALGTEMAKFTARSGKTYDRVKVSSIDDSGVTIRHEHGTARLRFSDLTPEQHSQFALNEESALLAEQEEQTRLANYERQLEREIEVIAARRETSAREEEGRDSAPSANSLAMVAKPTPRTSPLAKPASPVGGRSIYSYSAYRSYRPRYRYVTYSNPYQHCISHPPSHCIRTTPQTRVSPSTNHSGIITR